MLMARQQWLEQVLLSCGIPLALYGSTVQLGPYALARGSAVTSMSLLCTGAVQLCGPFVDAYVRAELIL